ncbi:WxL domain-containing protein [Enterococcus faecalis]|nr:WxL domain-containing protein [Enterococcus faecalis]EGS8239258.1 WxL domain-containing protein [Enterococcus faecalis]
MKRNKWQRLAAIGLCGSLIVNAFSGVTAVAETVTIESSQTEESVASEDTTETANKQELDKQKELEKSYNKVENSVEDQDKSEKSEDNNKLFQDTTPSIIPDSKNLSGVNENSSIESKAILPKAFVWAATATTNRTSIRLGNVVDYRLKFENITTTDTTSDIVGPIVISTVLSEGMSKPTSVMIKVGPEEQNVYLGEGPGNANSGNEYFVWTPGTRRLTVFINRLHGRNSGQSGYIKTLYFQSTITNGFHGEHKSIVSTINFRGFGEVRRVNTMQYLDQYVGNLALAGKLNIYNENGQLTNEQMTVNINPILYKSTNNRVEGATKRYPITMTNTEPGIYSFNTGNIQVGTSNGGSWLVYGNDLSINFATNTTNRIEKIVLAPPKSTLPDSRIGIMQSRPYAGNTVTTSNYDISNYNFSKSSNTRWTVPNLLSNSGLSLNAIYSDQLVGTTGQFRTGNYNKVINYYIYYKKVSEHFVNSTGAKIPPPTGFLENKQTEINNENYTFKQSGTLPDMYKGTNGKTYKFQGWYKGKTKPATLKTTKTPRYAVTYDDNDDLNVVYEETNFPELTYQFGFVNEAGQLVNPADIAITYDYINIAYRGRGSLNDSVSFEMIESNRAATVGNLIKVVFPASYVARPVETGWNGEAYSSFSIRLPKYYQTLNLYDKTGKINPKYPLPGITIVNNPAANIVKTEAQVISDLTLTQRADKSFTPTETYVDVNPGVKYPKILYTSIHSNNLASGLMSYSTVNNPIYYHLTNRKVTENFVDATGAKITPPTGFTQGKQTAITSNPYTFKQAGTLPDTYKAGTKTYKFKGWYKGKTKPATLKTTKTPSYAVTYDDNDDMTAVYEEVVPKTYNLPAKDVYFGYVDEAGNLLNPADFTVEAELGESTATESSVLGKVQGTNQVTSKLKKLSIPGKSYDFPVAEIKTYGTRYVNHTIPKRYKTISISPTATYTGDKTKYPMAKEIRKNIEAPYTIVSQTDGLDSYKLTTNGIVYGNKRIYWTWDTNKTFYASGIYSGIIGRDYNLSSPDKTIYYYLENRRVTENFVNAAGAKITPPTGFTQGKKTVINSDNFTYTQKGALPYTYKINNKPYVLKGWYKGKNKPAKLNQISKDNRNISYPVSYDDQDDVTVVYDELKLGGNTVQFGFVNEQGKYVPPTSNFNVSTDVGVLTNASYTTLQTVNSITKGNYLSLTIPAYNPTGGLGQGDIYYGTLNSIVTIPKYYKAPTVTPSSNYQGTVYPTVTGVIDFHNNSTTNEYLPSRLNVTSVISVNGSQTNYRLSQLTWSGEETRTSFTSLYKMAYNSMSDTTMSLAEYYATGTVNYYLENRRVTENFVDATGTKITAPTGFTQGNQIPMTSNTFKYTAAKALPASYSAGGKTYTFQGWYKGKTKPTTLSKVTTPTFSTTFDGNDDMTAVYKEEVPKASVTLTRTTAETVTSGGNVTWRATITNTSQAPLTTATIKKSTAWTAGLAAPTAMIVTPVGGTAKTVPVTATTWTNGVSLGVNIPVGKSATVQFTTKATGTAGKVLRAGITTSGNYSGVSASATVRVKDNDQAIVTPTAEGFISTPTFDFGQVAISGTKQQYGLKKAAAYYGNGTRNPYLRIKKTQPNWSLTAQLSQPKSATDSLPTATRLLLGAAPVSSFSNYNQPTELKNTIGTTKVINLTANNTATNIVANQQFTGSDVYQLDFVFDNIKLEVPASQGMTRQQYQATVTWNLVTGP